MNKMKAKGFSVEKFKIKTYDKVRYIDTDRQGHVNNAVFSTYFETGRVELLYNPKDPFFDLGSFVSVGLKLDLLSEIKWPGIVEIGTSVTKIGNSSISFLQGLFQDGKIVAVAETTLVQVDKETKRPKVLSEKDKNYLKKFLECAK